MPSDTPPPTPPSPPPRALRDLIPKCYVHDGNHAAGFCTVCRRFVCYPCGMAHQAAHARKN